MKLSQGSVFSGAKAERYCGKIVYGCVITARCDIAQDKYPVLSYIPVVSLEDWISKDGIEIFQANCLSGVEGDINVLFSDLKISQSLRLTQSLDSILKPWILNSDKKNETIKNRIAKLLQKYNALNNSGEVNLRLVIDLWQKDFSKFIKELISHKVTGHYYIDSQVSSLPECSNGAVALLRESAFLPREVAKQIQDGIVFENLSDSELDQLVSRVLACPPDGFVCPVSQIKSPNIEHLLQAFSSLFGRIGISDPRLDQISGIVEKFKESC